MGGSLRPRWDAALTAAAWPCDHDDIEVVELDECAVAAMRRRQVDGAAWGGGAASPTRGADSPPVPLPLEPPASLEDHQHPRPPPPRCLRGVTWGADDDALSADVEPEAERDDAPPGADGSITPYVDALSTTTSLESSLGGGGGLETPRGSLGSMSTATSVGRRHSLAAPKKVRIVDANVEHNRLGDIGALFEDGIEQLCMSRCNVPCLRDIGTQYSQLRVLWLNGSGVRALDGCYSLRGLEELYVAFNDIADLTPIAGLEALAVADLEGNAVPSLTAVQPLIECDSLRQLTLAGCPVDATPGYRGGVGHILPQITHLDDRAVAGDRDATDADVFTLADTLPAAPEVDVAAYAAWLDAGTPMVSDARATAKGEAGVRGHDHHTHDTDAAERTPAAYSDIDHRIVLDSVKRARPGERSAGAAAAAGSGLTVNTQEVLCGAPTRRLHRIREQQAGASVTGTRPLMRECW